MLASRSEKYFSCPSLLEFRTVCFHQFVFPLVFFNSRDRLRKKAGTVRCLLGNIFRLGNSHGAGGFFFYLGGGGEKISWISGGTCEDK